MQPIDFYGDAKKVFEEKDREREIYNQALEDFVKEYHIHLCNENCGEIKCVDDMDKCVYWFYADEVAEKLTK